MDFNQTPALVVRLKMVIDEDPGSWGHKADQCGLLNRVVNAVMKALFTVRHDGKLRLRSRFFLCYF